LDRGLGRHAPITEEYRGPAYYVPPGVPVPGHAVTITSQNLALLEAAFAEVAQALPRTAPCVVTVVGGVAAAVCFSSRLTDHAAEAGVQTLELYQRRGHGSAAVAGWAAAVRQRGLLPLYSTSWDNVTSQGLARRLGCVFYGEDFSVV
jgi:hypothetical protein